MKIAPDFVLNDQHGRPHRLTDYRGGWLVLYFYPKDDTPGCTTEACNFRDARADLAKLAEVVGVSTDSVDSHQRFADKYHLDFTLLSDPDHKVIAAYNSWKPKRLLGKEILGTQRNTFLIDPDGYIVKTYRGVDPKTHAQNVLEDLMVARRGGAANW